LIVDGYRPPLRAIELPPFENLAADDVEGVLAASVDAIFSGLLTPTARPKGPVRSGDEDHRHPTFHPTQLASRVVIQHQ
jgi:hypothetical protein